MEVGGWRRKHDTEKGFSESPTFAGIKRVFASIIQTNYKINMKDVSDEPIFKVMKFVTLSVIWFFLFLCLLWGVIDTLKMIGIL